MKKLIIATTLTVMTVCAPATTIYVDANAAGFNDGSSWTDAYNYLQDALHDPLLAYGDEIWVAQGIYKPDQSGGQSPGDRGATFQLVSGAGLYGGFPTGGGEFDSRDPNLYETILSGDLLGNDEPDFVNHDENSEYVVTGSGTDPNTCLDAFTIIAGYDYGMFNLEGSPTVTNCDFKENRLAMLNEQGITSIITDSDFIGNSFGGIFNIECSPTVTNCDFKGSYSGMANINSNSTVANCNFVENSHGMRNVESNPTVINSDFIANSATGAGGAGMNNNSSSPTVMNCTFIANSTGNRGGGGMFNGNDSSPTVTGCSFIGNFTETAAGGGMFNQAGSNSIVTDCIFSGNTAQVGGGMDNSNSDPVIVNCIFTGNLASSIGGVPSPGGGGGGGMYNWSSSPSMTNCTFTGNTALGSSLYNEGGGGMNNWGGNPTMTNCILWDNTGSAGGDEIALGNSAIIDINYCNIQGGPAAIYEHDLGNTINLGGGNIDVDPMFVDPNGLDGMIGTEDDNVRLLSGSPCIDAGDPNFIADPNYPTDLDGNPRIFNDRIDMGAYEYRLVVNAAVEVLPKTLNLKSNGLIAAIIQVPEPYHVEEIDVETVECQGAFAIRVNLAKNCLIVKFDRRDLQDLEPGSAVEVQVTGEFVDGTVFNGTNVITVINQ